MGSLKIRESLDELCSLSASPGNEKKMAERVKEILMDYCNEVRIDRFFNVVGEMHSKQSSNYSSSQQKKSRIMLCAHMDEVSLMVTKITDKGFLHFTNLGGVDARILPGQEVIVHGTEDLVGIIGAKPPHLITEGEANKAPKIEDLSIDVGMTSDSVKKFVHVGDNITYRNNPMYLDKYCYSNKTLDDRSGIAAMIETLKELKNLEFDSDVIAAANVQEEVGIRGATVSAFDIQPDLAIVIDAGHGDIPDASKEDVYTLGKGPAIGVGPVLNPSLTKFLISVAKECQIPYQIDVEEGSTGTEAWAAQISRKGIPTLLVSIPVRYMHTTVETLDVNDVANTARLIARFIAKLGNRLEEFICC